MLFASEECIKPLVSNCTPSCGSGSTHTKQDQGEVHQQVIPTLCMMELELLNTNVLLISLALQQMVFVDSFIDLLHTDLGVQPVVLLVIP